jgi:hypothetical protein
MSVRLDRGAQTIWRALAPDGGAVDGVRFDDVTVTHTGDAPVDATKPSTRLHWPRRTILHLHPPPSLPSH